MKKEIHPEYGETTITCACGAIVKVKSSGKSMHVNTCASCHPFFTGRATLEFARGRVDQFRKRYGKK